ncbi:hypothetical protein HQ585_03265 [candidate division KSB1 bacterium]|nr:hypothetical protein [candidate division KSB1 bacterium]
MVKHFKNSDMIANYLVRSSNNGLLLFLEKSSQKTAADAKSPENVSAFTEGIELIPLFHLDLNYIEA